jgi:ATP-dependent Clp protease, protease subunit
MNKKNEDNTNQMLEHGIIPIFGWVDQDMVERVKYAFTKLFFEKKEKIFVIISSTGGKVKSALEIFDILKLYPGQVFGLVVSEAMSSAAIILQACGTRMATPHSKILIHNGSTHVDINVFLNAELLHKQVEEHQQISKSLWTIVSLRTGRSMKEVELEFERDKVMNVEQAIEFGLIDSIFNKPLPWNIAEVLKV